MSRRHKPETDAVLARRIKRSMSLHTGLGESSAWVVVCADGTLLCDHHGAVGAWPTQDAAEAAGHRLGPAAAFPANAHLPQITAAVTRALDPIRRHASPELVGVVRFEETGAVMPETLGAVTLPALGLTDRDHYVRVRSVHDLQNCVDSLYVEHPDSGTIAGRARWAWLRGVTGSERVRVWDATGSVGYWARVDS